MTDSKSTRRSFLKTSTLAASALALRTSPLLSQSAQVDAHIEIIPGEPIGPISPELYGHFIEHLSVTPTRVAVANVAQTINCIHSLMLAQEDKFTLTPTFHVFQMYMPHRGGQAIRANHPRPATITSPTGGRLTHTFPPASVTTLQLTLA